MPEDLLRKQLRRLISAGNSREAAEHLCAYLGGESSSLYSSALQLMSRINRLEYRIVEKKIDPVESDYEKAQINRAILDLANLSYKNTLDTADKNFDGEIDQQGGIKKRRISRTPIIGFFLLLFTALLTYFTYRLGFPSPFDLTVNITSEDLDQKQVLQAGKVKLILDDYPLQPRSLDENGKAVFTEIPSEYENAQIRLIPIDMRFGIREQSAQTPSSSKNVFFKLFPLADTTFLRGTVFNPLGQRAPFAWLNFNNGLAYGFTDKDGRFQIGVPKKSGEQVRLQIEWKGIERYNDRLVLPESEPIILNLQ